MKAARLCGVHDQPDGTIRVGWSAVISKDTVTVMFPNRYWDECRARDEQQPLADGESWIDHDIDSLCTSIASCLKLQVKGASDAVG